MDYGVGDVPKKRYAYVVRRYDVINRYFVHVQHGDYVINYHMFRTSAESCPVK